MPTSLWWTIGESRFDSWPRQEISLLCMLKHRHWAQPTAYPVNVGGCFPGVPQQGRETHYSHPSSAAGNNGGFTPPFPHTSLCCGAKLIVHRNKFTLTSSS
jgi:hypothetical protein